MKLQLTFKAFFGTVMGQRAKSLSQELTAQVGFLKVMSVRSWSVTGPLPGLPRDGIQESCPDDSEKHSPKKQDSSLTGKKCLQLRHGFLEIGCGLEAGKLVPVV